jgi:hypothetical protein
VYLCLCFIYICFFFSFCFCLYVFLFLLNIVISFKCVYVEDEFNAREYNERESGYHEYFNVGEEGESGLKGHYQET